MIPEELPYAFLKDALVTDGLCDLLYQMFCSVPTLCKNGNMSVEWKRRSSVTRVFFSVCTLDGIHLT